MRLIPFALSTLLLSCTQVLWSDPSPSINSYVIDSSRIPDLASSLKAVGELDHNRLLDPGSERQGRCPLRSEDTLQVVAKLDRVATGIATGKCESRHDKLIASTRAMIASINEARLINLSIEDQLFAQDSRAILGSDPIDIIRNANNKGSLDATLTGDIAARAQSLLKDLSEATQDGPCVEHMKKKGLLSEIADAALGLGKIISGIPRDEAAISSTALMVIGSVVKVISQLSDSPFDWSIESDREQFIGLNCSFYDTVRDLTANDFFKAADTDIAEKIGETQALLERLEFALAEYITQKATFIEEARAKKDAYLRDQLGEKRVQFISVVHNVLADLASLDKNLPAGEGKQQFILILLKYAPQMLANYDLDNSQFRYASQLQTMLTRFNEQYLSDLTDLENSVFAKRYSDPITVYLKDALTQLGGSRDRLIQNFLSLKSDPAGDTNAQRIKKASNTFGKIEGKIREMLTVGQRQLSIINMGYRRSSFAPEEDGAHAWYSILDEVKTVKGLIVGKRGYSFLQHITKDANGLINRFENAYNAWTLKHDFNHPVSIEWACRDAFDLSKYFDQAKRGVEVADDFLQTNKGILTSDVDHYSYILKFIPYCHSPEFKLYGNMCSLEASKQIIAGNNDLTLDEIKAYQGKFQVNLGMLNLQVKRNEGYRKSIDWFVKQETCKSFL